MTSILAGCVAASPEPSPTPTPTETFGATISRTVTPADTCARLIDVNTVIYNVTQDVAQGRMAQQEADGFIRIAGRIVQAIAAEPDTGLGASVVALQAATPTAPPGGIVDFDPAGDEWVSAFEKAKDECTREGIQFYVEGFTGG